MADIGYVLSTEEHRPQELVRFAQGAEAAGFSFAFITDHFHPWISAQGNSPFAWSVLGAVAQATQRLQLGTAVTCPIARYHPAVVAQAAATVAALAPGRFMLGVGSGENLNEHVVGRRWPEAPVRIEMLREAVEIIRGLWRGDYYSFHGKHFTVEDAKLFTLPDASPPLLIAANAKPTAEMAAKLGDGLIAQNPSKDTADAYAQAGGDPGQRYCLMHVCWAPSQQQAEETALRVWPTTGLGPVGYELPTPRHFETVAKLVKLEDLRSRITLGPDAAPYLQAIQKYVAAGYSRIFVHQIGPDQEGFFRFFQREVLPQQHRQQAAA